MAKEDKLLSTTSSQWSSSTLDCGDTTTEQVTEFVKDCVVTPDKWNRKLRDWFEGKNVKE